MKKQKPSKRKSNSVIRQLKDRERKRVSNLESKVVDGQKVYLNPELNTPFRVHVSGIVESRSKTFNKYPKEFQYFLVRWAKYCRKYPIDDASRYGYADTLATKDYLKRGYSVKLLSKYFDKVTAGKDFNIGRRLAMNMILNKVKK